MLDLKNAIICWAPAANPISSLWNSSLVQAFLATKKGFEGNRKTATDFCGKTLIRLSKG